MNKYEKSWLTKAVDFLIHLTPFVTLFLMLLAYYELAKYIGFR